MYRLGMILIIFLLIAGGWAAEEGVASELTNQVADDFNEANGLWAYLGTAKRVADSADNMVLQLTPSPTTIQGEGDTGTVWLNQRVSPPFDVEFRYRITNNKDGFLGYGADGFVLMFNKLQNILPVSGGGMGFEADDENVDNGNGYGVEFDTFWNEGWENSGSHIAFFHKTPKSNLPEHLLAYNDVSGVNSPQWKYVKVEVTETSVMVYWGSQPDNLSNVLSWAAPQGSTLDMTYDGIGISASTGWGYSQHEIDDFTLTKYALDKEAPAIELLGEAEMKLTVGTPFVEPGYNAIDNVDLEVSVTNDGMVDVNTPGTYTIIYTASDFAGNTASVTRTVIVEGIVDKIKPILQLIGSDFVIIEQGIFYEDPGAIASDDVDPELQVSTLGEINSEQEGTYVLTYHAIDQAGNEAETATRTVVVVDREAIAATLQGDEDVIDIRRIASYLNSGEDLNHDGIVQVEEVRYLLSFIDPIFVRSPG